MIDPAQFLDTSVEGSNATTFVPVPADTYIATVVSGGIEMKEFTRKDGDKGYLANISWEITDEEKAPKVRDLTGMKQPKVRQTVFLDVTSEGGLETGPGKNVTLGRLREALGQNDPKKKWSFRRMEACTARVKVEHRTDSREGREGGVFAEVVEVTKL